MGLLSSLRFKAEDVPMQGPTVQGRIATAYFERIPGVGGPYRLVIGVEVLSPPDIEVDFGALTAWAHVDGTGAGYGQTWVTVSSPINGTAIVGDTYLVPVSNGHTTINGQVYGLTQFHIHSDYQFSDPPGTAFQVQALLRGIQTRAAMPPYTVTPLPDKVNTTPYGPVLIPNGDGGASPSNPWTPLPVPPPTPPPATPPPAPTPAPIPAPGGGGGNPPPATGGGGGNAPPGSGWTWPFIHAILAFLHFK